jgi:Tol biopolymer transport system component
MIIQRCVPIVLSLSALTNACGSDPAEPVTGSLELTISTTGRDLDPDGYTVTVDAGSPLAAPTNGSVTIPDLAPGVHTVSLADLAGNCSAMTPAPLEVTIPDAAGAVAELEVTCTPIYTLAFRGESGIELTDAAGTIRRTLFPTENVFTGPLAWSPDGRLLAVLIRDSEWGHATIHLANMDDSSLRQFADLGYLTRVPVGVWSRDGRELLLEISLGGSNSTPTSLARYPLDESYPPQAIYSLVLGMSWGGVIGARGVTWPVWSPDASQILIHETVKTEMYIMSRDGTSQHLLAEGAQPDWSPDGSLIAYVTSVRGPGTLRLIHPDGSNDRQLTAPAMNESDTGPAWSGDGSRVAFLRKELAPDSSVTSVHAYVVDRDGTNERQLAVLPNGELQPAWSADGLHLAYSGRGGTYVVNVDGSGFHLVSTVGGQPAQWRP